MPVGTSLDRLVDEFVATLSPYGIVVERQAVEQEMRERIAEIADRLRVGPETVLQDHACPSWGREMAADVLDQVRASEAAESREVRRATLAG